MIFIAIKFLHLTSLLFLFSASLFKNIVLSQKTLAENELYWCRIADKVSGASAGLMVITGGTLIYISAKGVSFYFLNSLFWLKIGVLIIATLLILKTKIFFRKHGVANSKIAVQVPKLIQSIMRFDAISLLVMALCAVSLVNGYGR